jgi:hypothetical protein
MRRTMFSVTMLIALAILLLLTFTSSANAFGNAHFIKSATSLSLSGSSLVCSFKEAGLESGATETVTCSATALTTYECVNGGGKNPSASNKTTTQSNPSASGEFTADKNGNIVGSLKLEAPTATQLGFSCPSGQTVTFVSVTYSGASITDEDTKATVSASGSFSYTNPNAP